VASLVGHVLGAGACWAGSRRVAGKSLPTSRWWYVLVGAIAIAPDLDVVIPVLFTAGPVSHRGPSHSLLVACGLAVLGTMVVRACKHRLLLERVFAAFTVCAVAHPVLDYLMGCGPRVPFLWPFVSKAWLCPIQLIPTAYYATSPSGLLSVVFMKETWIGITLEGLSLGAVWMTLECRSRPWTMASLSTALVGFALTYYIYN
jgi:membrane-bound metal-dependent hydrolase YbcI (DUF457 family)